MTKRLTRLVTTAVAILGSSVAAHAALTWGWDWGYPSDSSIAEEITDAMNTAVYYYNSYGNYTGRIGVAYNYYVQTAQSNYHSTIEFGGSRNARVAQHEIAHWMGCGTLSEWDSYSYSGQWHGTNGINKLYSYDGYGSTLYSDTIHFWPYGLNYDSEGYSSTMASRNIGLVGAMRRDMGYSDGTRDNIVNDGTYKVINASSGRALGVSGGSTSNGAAVDQYDYFGDSSQKWTFTQLGSGVYKIIGEKSGRALDVDNSNTDNGGKVQIYDYNGNNNQKWYVQRVGTRGAVKIISLCNGKALDMCNGSDNSALIEQWSESSSANQQWYIQSPGVSNGTYKLIARHSGKAMDAKGRGTSNGTQIQQYTYNSGTNQQWTVSDTGSGNYKLIGVQSGKALDIYRGDSGNGTKVELWDYSGGSNQLFKLAATDSGYYRITPNCATGSCLDVKGGSSATGNSVVVQLYGWNGGTNQQWSFQQP